MTELSKDAKRFNNVTRMLGRMAQQDYLDPILKLLTVSLAKVTFKSRKGRKRESVEGLTKEWLRMFPREICSIEKIEDDTGYGLVHADCSLVGTGNVKACYKLMEYDRAMVEAMGGTFVVLESRANPAIKRRCKVAIRKRSDSRKDLIPAHLLD